MKAIKEINQELTPLRKHIIDAIDAEGFGLEVLPVTTKEKLQFLADRFNSEFGYNIKRIGYMNSMIDWLQGLAINIEYRNHVILEMGYLFGMLEANASEQAEDRFLNNWFNRLATATLNMFEEFEVKY